MMVFKIDIDPKYTDVLSDIAQAQKFKSSFDFIQNEMLSIIKDNLEGYGYDEDGVRLDIAKENATPEADDRSEHALTWYDTQFS
jgi:phage anti-repressor protein